MKVGTIRGVPAHLQIMCWHRRTNHILRWRTRHWKHSMQH
jgi:hypothetical protein